MLSGTSQVHNTSDPNKIRSEIPTDEAGRRSSQAGGSEGADQASRAGIFNQVKNIARKTKNIARKTRSIDNRLGGLSESGKDAGAIEKKIAWASSRVLDYLWGLAMTVVGFIIAFIALNVIGFLKMIGVLKFIRFRAKDIIGIIAMDVVVLCAMFIILSPIILLITIAEDPKKAIDIFGFGFVFDVIKTLF